MCNDQQTAEEAQQARSDGRDAEGRERPDLRGPRGNQEVEEIDVERGRGKIDRIVGW
jgi:hypothetical protein